MVLAGAVITTLAVLGACGDDTVLGGDPSSITDTAAPTTVPAPTVVLRYVTTGGCEMMGPNCPTYVLWSDGAVEISRTGQPGPAEVAGSIGAEPVAQWTAAVAGLDAAHLATEVGPGACNSCVDGADIVVTVTVGDATVVLDSTELGSEERRVGKECRSRWSPYH